MLSHSYNGKVAKKDSPKGRLVGAYRTNSRENNNSKYSRPECIVSFVLLHASLLLRSSHRRFKPTHVSRDVSVNILGFDSWQVHQVRICTFARRKVEFCVTSFLLGTIPLRFRIFGDLTPQLPGKVFRYNYSFNE